MRMYADAKKFFEKFIFLRNLFFPKASYLRKHLKGGLVMKKALLIIISVLAIVATAFALVACDNSVKTSKSLKTAAFAAVGAAESDVEYVVVNETETGSEVEFVISGVKYNVYLDSQNNPVKLKINDAEIAIKDVPVLPSSPDAKYIGTDKALEAALSDAGLTKDDVTKTEVELDFDDGKYLYDVEFTYGQTEYEYKINATDGSVYMSEINGVTVKEPSVSGKTFIGAEAAKEKSLTAANVTAEKATFTKVKIDSDHGVYVYEIKFTADGTKYEYKIHAETGEVIKFEIDGGKTGQPGNAEDVEKAKSIALAHAGVAAGKATFTEVKLETKRGVKIYEIEFTADGFEYEYEINAATFEIIAAEKDIDD